MRSTGFALTLVCVFAASARGQEPGELAQKAKAVLQTYCHRCHGENGSLEGGVNYLLDRNQLVARKKVMPGDPGKSALIRRIALEEMPPEGEKKPSAEEV